MSSFLKFLLIYFLAIVNLAKSDDTMELTCSSNKDCTSFEDKIVGSDCKNGECTCWLRRTENNHEKMPCIPRSTTRILGERSRTCPCDLPHTECVGGLCKCIEGFMQSDKSSKCVPKSIMVGKSCEVSEQCKKYDKLTECIEKVCQCPKRFTEIGNQCRSVVSRGKSLCKDVGDCQENEECFEERCACKNEFVASEIKSQEKCVPFANLGHKCNETLQCEMGLGAGSTCENNICICNSNHTQLDIGDKTICHRSIYYGDSCNSHNECVAYRQEAAMSCRNHKCVCSDGYELWDAYTKRCVKSMSLRSSSDKAKSLHVLSILVLSCLIAWWKF